MAYNRLRIKDTQTRLNYLQGYNKQLMLDDIKAFIRKHENEENSEGGYEDNSCCIWKSNGETHLATHDTFTYGIDAGMGNISELDYITLSKEGEMTFTACTSIIKAQNVPYKVVERLYEYLDDYDCFKE